MITKTTKDQNQEGIIKSQKQPQRCSVRKGVLKNLEILQKNTCVSF